MGCTVSRNAMVTDAYPHGMAQPCVLAVYGDEAQDEGSVLFKWNRWQVCVRTAECACSLSCFVLPGAAGGWMIIYPSC